MECFMNDDSNIDFMVSFWVHFLAINYQTDLIKCAWVGECYSFKWDFGSVQVACMQFINIVVHSVENMNFRVHLQYEFTHLGLDKYLEVSHEFWPNTD